jgi:hypothetical protein
MDPIKSQINSVHTPKFLLFYDTFERHSSIYVAVRGSAVGLGTALQAGSIPDGVIGIFN